MLAANIGTRSHGTWLCRLLRRSPRLFPLEQLEPEAGPAVWACPVYHTSGKSDRSCSDSSVGMPNKSHLSSDPSLSRHPAPGLSVVQTSVPSGHHPEWNGIGPSYPPASPSGGISVSLPSEIAGETGPCVTFPLFGHGAQGLGIHLIGGLASSP